MSEENLLRARQNCCRLCLAPQTECISIINSYAADREPLATKIHNCVNIKITPNDRLSLHICHACISYLNSWQSFKNRCVSSQSKQRNWLDANKQQQLLDNNVSISEVNNVSGNGGSNNNNNNNNNNNSNNNNNNNSSHSTSGCIVDENGEQDQDDLTLDRTTNILEGITSLKKRKSLTVYVSPKKQPNKQQQYQQQQQQQQQQQPQPQQQQQQQQQKQKQEQHKQYRQIQKLQLQQNQQLQSQQQQQQLQHQTQILPIPQRQQQQSQSHLQQQQQQPSQCRKFKYQQQTITRKFQQPPQQQQQHQQQMQQQQYTKQRRQRRYKQQKQQKQQLQLQHQHLQQQQQQQQQQQHHQQQKRYQRTQKQLQQQQQPLSLFQRHQHVPIETIVIDDVTTTTTTMLTTTTKPIDVADDPAGAAGTAGTGTGVGAAGIGVDAGAHARGRVVDASGDVIMNVAGAGGGGGGGDDVSISIVTLAAAMPTTTLSFVSSPLATLTPLVTAASSNCSTVAPVATTAMPAVVMPQFQSAAQQLRFFRRYTYHPLPAMPIKDEPMDTDDEDSAKHEESDEMVDPSLFLERVDHEGDVSIMDTNYDYNAQRTAAAAVAAASLPPATVANVAAAGDNKVAQCRACNLQFSTRANARRHERNLHPNLFELSLESPNNTPITKPTPALAAALELQRAATAAATVEATKAAATGSITTQKYRQEVMNAFNKCEGGGYDYDNPEKYQHLLSDEKITFIQQNSEFLEQYQHMICRCCNKHFTTYKNFMAHIRKKYPTLPRNLCFNCLKQNESKALFISHLKKRNCINLYRILNCLSSKSTLQSVTPERMRAKELLINKMYECKLCPKQFRTKHEFRTHVYDRHADVQRKDNASIQCSFCNLEIVDPVDRKRHYNNMDCIVSLRCVTCKGKFDNHQRFLDHVYHEHLGMGDPTSGRSSVLARQTSAENLPVKRSLSASGGGGGGGGASSNDESLSSGTALTSTPTATIVGVAGATANVQTPAKSQYFSRMPQACPICGQQYNNYNNVLRHMESKHPNNLPETYKCVRCGTGFPRISNLREHMITAHGTDRNRISGGFEYIVNADALKLIDGSNGSSGSGTANIYSGRYDYVMKDLMSINGGTLDDDDDDTDSNAAKRLRLDTSLPSATITSGVGGGNGNGNGSGNGNGNNNGSGNSSNVNLQSSQKECPVCCAVFNNNIGLSNHMRSHTAAAAANAANAAALAQANRMTPKSLTITATPSTTPSLSNTGDSLNASQTVTAAQEAHYRRGFEQAADRRFRRMRCQICQRRFSSKKSYRYHMFNDHQIRNVQFIKCKLCNADFAHEKGLKVHLFKVHNTLIKDEMIIKQFECDICSIVYTSESELLQHKKSVHGAEDAQADDGDRSDISKLDSSAISTANLSTISTPASGGNNTNISTPSTTTGDGTTNPGPLYWYQCKYCPSNFNTNKKLAIHINSHDEFDSKDYSCKDCGNVYSGRKSLWVHRYKKHPQIAEPSECVLCRKVFFDRQMLENHTPTCNRKPITATGALAETVTPATSRPFYKHKTGDDEDEEDEDAGSDSNSGAAGTVVGTLGGGQVEVSTMPSATTSLKFKIPEVACTICGARFSDQDLFAKHIQRHEQELYTDNPLAAMFDDGPSDPNQFYLDRVNDNGEYACDLCAKTFTQMTALKVHRKWHFRGDSKQNQLEGDLAANAASNNNNTNSSNNSTISSHNTSSSIQPHLQELHAVGLMPNHQLQKQQQHSKSLKRKRELKCEYCPSTFISNNNLRRHLFELHKNEVSNLPEPPKIVVDEALSCRRCNMKFESMDEWIEHKVNDARTMRPFGPFQWGCDLCGEYVSRKEKLINHINNHHKEGIIAPVEQRKKEQTTEKSKTLPTANQKEQDMELDADDANSRQSDIIGNNILPGDAEEYDDADDDMEDDDDDDDVEEDEDEQLIENDVNDEEHEDADGGGVLASDDIDDDDDDDHFGDADVEIVAENVEVNDDDDTDDHDDNEADVEGEDDDEDLDDVESDVESENEQKVSKSDSIKSEIDKKSIASANETFSRSNSHEKVRKDIAFNDKKEQKKLMPELTNQGAQATATNSSSTTMKSPAATATLTVPKLTISTVSKSSTLTAKITTNSVLNADKPSGASVNGKSGSTANATNATNATATVATQNASSNSSPDSNSNVNVNNTNRNNSNNNNSDSSSDSSDDDDSGDSSDSSSSSSNSTSTNSTGEARKAAAAAINNAAAAANQVKSRFACDLCQVYFDSQPDLQKHVKMHFLNGPGSVTVTNSSSSSSSVKTGAAAAKGSQKSLSSGSGSSSSGGGGGIDVGTK